MWKRKDIKRRAKAAVLRNYVACIAVCFIMVFIAGEYGNSSQIFSTYDSQNVANMKFDKEQKEYIVNEILDMCDKINPNDQGYQDKLIEAINKTAEKYDIDDIDSVANWVKIFNEQGADGLAFKEVTFFATSGEESGWGYLSQAANWVSANKVGVEIKIDNTVKNSSQRLSAVFDSMTKEHTSSFKFINSIAKLLSDANTWDVIMAFGSALFSLLISLFVVNVLLVGERRFFLESRTYKKTKIGRMGYLYRERSWHPIKTMFIKDVKTILWMFTIVGIPIKHYEYQMIPFILAENPNMKTKKVFRLSRAMMKKNKWRTFILDLSFLVWSVLPASAVAIITYFIYGETDASVAGGIVTSVVMLAFLNAYKTATKTELYIALRREAIQNNYMYSDELNDKYLDLDLLEEMTKSDRNNQEATEENSVGSNDNTGDDEPPLAEPQPT